MPRKKPRKKTFESITSSILEDIKRSHLSAITASSFRSWYMNWPWLILCVLVDFVFLVATSSVITLIQFTLFEHLEALMKMAGQATGGLMNVMNQTAQVSTGLTGLSQSGEFQYHVNVIFKYLGLMVLLTFILWIIFQGISWFIAYRMSTKKRLPFLVFWKNFALQSIPFYLLTVFWIFISVRILFAIKSSIAPFMSVESLNSLFAFFVIVTWYFGALCYTMTSRHAYRNFKQSFIYGVRKFPKTVQSALVIAVIFIVIDLFLRINFIRQDPFLMIVFGAILFMPALVFARIMLFKTRQEYWPGTAKKR